MERPRADAAAVILEARRAETEPLVTRRARAVATDLDHGKPVGAVVAAAKVLRALHAAERPLNASAVARATGLYRGTAYNILKTLEAEGFVGYDEAARTYSVSLHILEFAHGVLRRSGLMDLARPLMHAVCDACGVSVYLSKVTGPCSHLLLDWVGAALLTDLYVTVGRQFAGPAGASGVVMAAFGDSSDQELEALLARAEWYRKPSFADFRARVREARSAGVAVDRDGMFRGITLVSAPVLSPASQLLLVLTAAGHSHDIADDAVGPLARALQSAAARLSESVRLLRLG
jgi:DNA-binding IclR family transcriptional regulator